MNDFYKTCRCNKEFRQVPFQVELHKEMNNPSNLHNFGSVDRSVERSLQ